MRAACYPQLQETKINKQNNNETLRQPPTVKEKAAVAKIEDERYTEHDETLGKACAARIPAFRGLVLAVAFQNADFCFLA